MRDPPGYARQSCVQIVAAPLSTEADALQFQALEISPRPMSSLRARGTLIWELVPGVRCTPWDGGYGGRPSRARTHHAACAKCPRRFAPPPLPRLFFGCRSLRSRFQVKEVDRDPGPEHARDVGRDHPWSACRRPCSDGRGRASRWQWPTPARWPAPPPRTVARRSGPLPCD